MNGAALLLAAIAGRETEGYLEIRHARRPGGFPTEPMFFDVSDVPGAAAYALEAGQALNVYAGIAPRWRRGTGEGGTGRDSDVRRAWLLSADCDDDDALVALLQFTPIPTFIINTGGITDSGQPKRQAHWELTEPISADQRNAAVKRLADRLGGDPKIRNAGRVMRVPGTAYNKHHRRGRCELVEHAPWRTYRAQDIVGQLEPPRAARASADVLHTDEDILKTIPAPEYVADLIGRRPDHRGYVRCPFHSDGRERTPSLCLYGPDTKYPLKTPSWFCFGCERGGDIYELAALVAGYPRTPSGGAFLTLRLRLTEFYIKKGAA
jgi:RepB DNA-primase from phage plasmid